MGLSKTLLKKWVAALRSGKYTQGQSTLCVIDPFGQKKYCCLGVLCDISKAGKWEFETPNFAGYEYTTYKIGKKTYRDSLVEDDITLYKDFDKILFNMDEKFHKKLMEYNDEKRMSFKKIAYEIERHFHLNGR